ncbi:MAG: sialidase family protein [Planctomycetota bacterium]|jgi:predicted neuraminidase|nr:sialidase family protein [Planctomycetota bacterium]
MSEETKVRTVFTGVSPNQLVCDTTLRAMPDGTWALFFLGGGDTEPCPANAIFVCRSADRGETWSAPELVDLGVKRANPSTAVVPTEISVIGGRCTLWLATHRGGFRGWETWFCHSEDSGRTWGALQPAPGFLCQRSFLRKMLVLRDGRLLLAYQHYPDVGPDDPVTLGPQNGVLESCDGGATWSIHGAIRHPDPAHYGWEENSIVELSDGRVAMLMRADGDGCLRQAIAEDGGRTWPAQSSATAIPNPGSKLTLYGGGGGPIGLVHNPTSQAPRTPLALWTSHDDMQTWSERRILVPASQDGADKALNYPDGFLTPDGTLHIAIDDNRRHAVYVRTSLATLG